MIVQKTIHVGRTIRRSWKKPAFVAVYATLVVLLFAEGILKTSIPIAIPAMLGTALSILLGFRTNSAYERWWEARKVWGAIVNDSRSFARLVIALFRSAEDEEVSEIAAIQRDLIDRQLAWPYVLARSLRGQESFQDVVEILAEDEIQHLREQENPANAILQTQALRLRDARDKRYLDVLPLLRIQDKLGDLCDHMGMCERIKNTVFPAHYGILVRWIIWLFFLLLPSGLVPSLGWLTVPVAFATAMIFLMIEMLGSTLQDPFENAITDTPMLAISRTIEINLRQQLGEAETPPKLEPVDGVLM